MKKYFPNLLPKDYSKRDLKQDAIAALIVTAIAVPESLGFAALVGLPLETGLYTALFAPIVFALLASSRRLVVGADSATASLIAAVAGILTATSISYPVAVAALTIMSGLVLLAMSVFRFGFIADLISKPVLIGFFAGVGVQLILHRLPDMLGIAQIDGNILTSIYGILNELSAINLATVLVATIVLACAFLLPRRYPQLFIGLVLATLASVVFDLESYGVALVGALPSGLPPLQFPVVPLDFLLTLIPAALSIALVIVAQSSAVIRTLANEHEEKVNIDTDIRALGFANIAAGLSQGFSLNGSPPRSIAADSSGSKSQMVNIIMAVLIGGLLLFASQLFAYIPVAALAAVVFVIGVHLIRINDMERVWRTHRIEFFIMLLTLGSVVAFGVQQGLFIAIIASLIERLRRQYHPADQIILRDGTLSEWGKQRLAIQEGSLKRPGILVYSFDGSLFFENVEYFINRVMSAVRDAKEPVTTVIIDTGAIEAIDYTAVDGIRRLHQQLKADEIGLLLAHVSPSLQSEFERYGIDQLVGKQAIFPTLNAALHSDTDLHRSSTTILHELRLPTHEFVVIGGAVMEALGLRKTKGIDMVVSDKLYERFHKKPEWKEFVHDDGKRVLSHNGYHMMRTWMGRDLSKLQQDAFEIDGIAHMSVKQLIACKQRLGRSKDRADILLLEQFRRHHSDNKTSPLDT